ncbi:uncharacterized protein LOC115100871 isoform X2 [Rhinatrema bivittatum]|uniref:uncharacterized protein LOC115100871 isoform X2 n=1 Tax=Rhinatrema bivittatum TaxID=194408 RepID=UPI0011267BC4|nr:uncharacterized protein LOC115100871 isoform X2 [Rhinatrema bivittatum]
MEIPEADSSSSMGSPGWLAVLDSLPTEQMNFLLGQICALPLALIFRKYLHPTKTNPIVRHAVATLLGFYLCMFCYGWCTVFILGEVIVSYVILLVSDRSRVHVYSLLFAMGYLTIFQINRLLDSSEESSDFTVPMMILTQKITKVAFELHDGTARPPESLSPSQKIQALRKLPSPLEYLSYNFNFMGILAGPLCSYNDYVSFIEGTHYQRGGDLDQLKENGTQKRSEPSPTNAVLENRCVQHLPDFPWSDAVSHTGLVSLQNAVLENRCVQHLPDFPWSDAVSHTGLVSLQNAVLENRCVQHLPDFPWSDAVSHTGLVSLQNAVLENRCVQHLPDFPWSDAVSHTGLVSLQNAVLENRCVQHLPHFPWSDAVSHTGLVSLQNAVLENRCVQHLPHFPWSDAVSHTGLVSLQNAVLENRCVQHLSHFPWIDAVSHTGLVSLQNAVL